MSITNTTGQLLCPALLDSQENSVIQLEALIQTTYQMQGQLKLILSANIATITSQPRSQSQPSIIAAFSLAVLNSNIYTRYQRSPQSSYTLGYVQQQTIILSQVQSNYTRLGQATYTRAATFLSSILYLFFIQTQYLIFSRLVNQQTITSYISLLYQINSPCSISSSIAISQTIYIQTCYIYYLSQAIYSQQLLTIIIRYTLLITIQSSLYQRTSPIVYLRKPLVYITSTNIITRGTTYLQSIIQISSQILTLQQQQSISLQRVIVGRIRIVIQVLVTTILTRKTRLLLELVPVTRITCLASYRPITVSSPIYQPST